MSHIVMTGIFNSRYELILFTFKTLYFTNIFKSMLKSTVLTMLMKECKKFQKTSPPTDESNT